MKFEKIPNDELNDMRDVVLDTPRDGEFLTYDDTNDYWFNTAKIQLSGSSMNTFYVNLQYSILNSGESTTTFKINNSAVNGDPILQFDLSNSPSWVVGVDDSDGDSFIIGRKYLSAQAMKIDTVKTTTFYGAYRNYKLHTFKAGSSVTVGATNIYKNAVSAAPQTITSISNIGEAHVITIIAVDGNTTIADNANIKLSGSANFTMAADDTLTLVYTGSYWLEVARSVR